MKMKILIILSVLCSCTPLTQSSVNSSSNAKVLTFIDREYEPEIKTITLHRGANDPNVLLQPAVIQLGESDLVLEFDDLTTQRDTYYAKIIHCNADWTKSQLMDLDYIKDYNEFPLNTFEFSIDTHVPYVHYWFNVPAVKIPGNYLLIVYRGSDKNDLVLSRRFMVYDTQISFENERNLIGAGNTASLNQQINFTINYKNLDIVNPMENVIVVVRQNQRWDNLAANVKPSFVRESEKQIEYRFFDDAKMFKGGNEFRFFDLRSLGNPGRNVLSVNKTAKPFEVYIQKDKTRSGEVYSQLPDVNGGFLLDNLDYRDSNFSNYAFVNFSLASKYPVKGDVYVTGAFNYWNLNPYNKMTYDSVSREYHSKLLLKQGRYDYQYYLQSKEQPSYFFEGSHYETENMYEVFVYYRPFQPKADLLIGYIRLERNQR